MKNEHREKIEKILSDQSVDGATLDRVLAKILSVIAIIEVEAAVAAGHDYVIPGLSGGCTRGTSEAPDHFNEG